MKKVELMGVGALALIALSACADQSLTGVEPVLMRPSFVVAPTPNRGQICSNGSIGNVVTGIAEWAPKIVGSEFINKGTTDDVDRPRENIDVFTSTFSVPSGATNIQISGKLVVDNDVVITAGAGNPVIFNTFANTSAPNAYTAYPVAYPNNAPDTRTKANYNPGSGFLTFGALSGFAAGVDNTITFNVYNDDDPNTAGNPSAISFCYTVTYKEPVVEPLIPVFVIGDVQDHDINDNVYFWGAQWWKNNEMSGTVSPGVAAFKGYATQSTLVCGGTWVSLPGNSSKPPATIADRIAVIVTSKVIKAGNDISGDITQIVLVDHDKKYDNNPGHEGQGIVRGYQCGGPGQ